jgi:hypothetical protein
VATKATAIAAAVALLLGAGSVSAATVEVTYTGTITYVTDPGGAIKSIFGTDSLLGDSYVATYVFNTSLGQTLTSPTLNYAIGGSVYSDTSPLLSNFVTVTVGTVPVTYSISNHNADEIEGCLSCVPTTFSVPVNQQYELAEDFQESGTTTTRAYIQSLASDPSGALPISITQPFIYLIGPSDIAYSQLAFSTSNSSTAAFAEDEIEVDNVSTVTVTVTPLPTTWTFFLIGFAVLGSVGYRRRSSNTMVGGATRRSSVS